MTIKRLPYTILRIVLSFGLIGLLLTRLSLNDLILTLRSIGIFPFFLALSLLLVRVIVSSYRWKVMIAVKDIHISLRALISYYFVGIFFNLLLPTTLGGDVARGYKLSIYSKKKIDSATSVLMERFIGLSTLLIISLASLLYNFKYIKDTKVTFIVFGVSAAYFLFFGVLFSEVTVRKIESITKTFAFWNLGDKISRFYNSLHTFIDDKPVLAKTFGLSVIYQVVGIFAVFLLSQSIGLDISLVYFLTIMPIIFVITMIPVSIGGLGIREGSFVFFLTREGVSTVNALSLSLLFYAQIIIIGIIGAIIYGVDRYHRSPKSGFLMNQQMDLESNDKG